MTTLLYNLCRLTLLLLSLAFLSFFLITIDTFSFLQQVVEYSTAYLPVLLIPVTIIMVALLLLRYMGKEKNEEIGFGDLFAAVLAVAFQVAAIIVWRAQGNEIAGPLAANIPNVELLSKQAATLGVLGVAALQFLAFFFYWKAGPDRTSERRDAPASRQAEA